MTRDQLRGQMALAKLSEYVEPQSLFVSGESREGRKLYALETMRSEIIEKCAQQWARIADVDKSEYWTRSIPQMLHDTLEAYQTECGIIAAEAFLKRHGWTVTRPTAEI